VTERAAYIGRIRNLARGVAQSYRDSRARLGYPMASAQIAAMVLEEQGIDLVTDPARQAVLRAALPDSVLPNTNQAKKKVAP
jgi:glycyl-tRNA synthetase alpha chain